MRSTPAWLAWQTGLHRGQVGRAISTADLAELLPTMGAAWKAGQVSTNAMETIAAARVPGHDEKLAACETEFSDLARRGEHKGRTNISGELSGDAAETVTTALNAFMDPPAETDDRTPAQRRADAFVRICQIALHHGAAGVRAAANVTVIVDWATFTRSSSAGSSRCSHARPRGVGRLSDDGEHPFLSRSAQTSRDLTPLARRRTAR